MIAKATLTKWENELKARVAKAYETKRHADEDLIFKVSELIDEVRRLNRILEEEK